MGVTSIQIDSRTRERLAKLKSSPRETYDELLNKLFSLVPEGDEEGRFSRAFRVGLLEARLDIRQGVKKRLGL
jgi:hypothetical protein